MEDYHDEGTVKEFILGGKKIERCPLCGDPNQELKIEIEIKEGVATTKMKCNHCEGEIILIRRGVNVANLN